MLTKTPRPSPKAAPSKASKPNRKPAATGDRQPPRSAASPARAPSPNPAAGSRGTQTAQALPRLLPIASIEPDPRNPRLEPGTPDASLAASLDQLDLLNPITVRPAGKRYRIIAGERRYHAAKLAGWKEVPAVVRDVDDATAAAMMVAENLHQQTLNPIEKARSVALLCSAADNGGGGLNCAEVGRMFGKDRGWAHKLVSLLKLPAEWQARVASREIGVVAAARLLPYLDRPEVLAAAAQDLAANPDDWRDSYGRFRDRLAFVVQCFDNLAELPADQATDQAERLQEEPLDSAAAAELHVYRESGGSPTPIPGRRAPATMPDAARSSGAECGDAVPGGKFAPGPGVVTTGAEALTRILGLIPWLDSREQLAAVDAALNARDEELAAGRKRKVSDVE